MKYVTLFSTKFKKDFKRCQKRNCDISLLRQVIDLLSESGTLPSEYRLHKLSGKYAGLWECHIQGDWLLVWDQNDTELTLLFTDTGTHSDLF